MSDLNKSSMRSKVLTRLENIDRHDFQRHSEMVCQNILGIPDVQNASCVMAYLSQPPELDLDPLLRTLLAKGIHIAVPDVGASGHEMQPIELHSLDESELDVDRFGIRTPCIHKEICPTFIDVIIIPGVAFSSNGARLGRGAGFYDRFLNSISDQPLRIGACFDVQNVASIPTASHDIEMHMVVTESSIMDCKA